VHPRQRLFAVSEKLDDHQDRISAHLTLMQIKLITSRKKRLRWPLIWVNAESSGPPKNAQRMEVAMTELSVRKSGLFQSLADAFARFQKRRARRAELDAMGPAESERVAHDVGLSQADLLSLTSQDEDSAELMERRLADSGIDIKSVDPVLLRDMQRCCSQCDSKELCAHELDDKPKAANWPSYCPNEQTITALTAVKCH
jgi:hypothetical protein